MTSTPDEFLLWGGGGGICTAVFYLTAAVESNCFQRVRAHPSRSTEEVGAIFPGGTLKEVEPSFQGEPKRLESILPGGAH